MYLKSIVLTFTFVALNSIPSLSQAFFKGKDLSVSASYGWGKIQYFFDHTPIYIHAADQEASEYSPSWAFRIEKKFHLNRIADFSLAFSHITITEKTHTTAKPSWLEFFEKNLAQGFFHIIPGFQIKLPDDRFAAKAGIRLGTANFIGYTNARESSNSILHSDIALESGATIRINRKLFVDALWIHGFTKYDYSIGMPVLIISYFKYQSIQIGIKYIIREGNVQ